jgi:hypothetical protein
MQLVLLKNFIISILVIVTIVSFSSCSSGGGDGGGESTPSDYYFWESLGSPGEGMAWPKAVAVGSDSRPLVTFRDIQNGGRVHVLKWSSGNYWVDFGFVSTGNDGETSLVLDPSDDKPIVVYVDSGNNARTRVKKWDSGTSWIDLGFVSSGPTNGWYNQPSITLDPSDNKPVVAFSDGDNGWKIHVKKWSTDTNWTDLGFVSSGEGYFPSITIDPTDNNPILAFVDAPDGQKARVMKWSGSSWIDLGYPNTGTSLSTRVVIDPSDNKPIVAFVDSTAGGEIVYVKKWDSGTTWINLGHPSSYLGYPINYNSREPSIVIDPSDNKPVVSFQDWESPLGADIHVKKWDSGTTWTGIGWPSSGSSVYSSIAIDPVDFKPVVMYTESYEPDAKVFVSKHP